MNTLDVLSSRTNVRSIAMLSLELVFQREYGSVYQSIDDFAAEREEREEKEKGLWKTTRKAHYRIKGNRPVTISNSYSVLEFLPEKTGERSRLDSYKRTATMETEIMVVLQQLAMLLSDEKLFWWGKCVSM
jgi:hypothetical protein